MEEQFIAPHGVYSYITDIFDNILGNDGLVASVEIEANLDIGDIILINRGVFGIRN